MSVGVYILTGFLGSGKTTLLSRLLAYLRNKDGNVVVMMNEMGEEDIDGEQLQGYGFPVRKLLDGCICCSIRGELTEGLKEIVQNFHPDHLLIETTGVADPIDVVDALTHPDLCEELELKGIVTVVDASRFLSLNSRFQSNGALVKTVRNQVKYADLIVLNKIDLVDKPQLAKVEEKIRELNGGAPIHSTVHSEMDLDELLNVKRMARETTEASAADRSRPAVQMSIGRFSPLERIKRTLGFSAAEPSLYNSIETFSCTFKGPVDGEKFEDFLYDLPKNVFRAKGYVRFHNRDEVISFQHTDNQVHLIPFSDFHPKPVAVFIGENLDRESIMANLERCYKM